VISSETFTRSATWPRPSSPGSHVAPVLRRP